MYFHDCDGFYEPFFIVFLSERTNEQYHKVKKNRPNTTAKKPEKTTIDSANQQPHPTVPNDAREE